MKILIAGTTGESMPPPYGGVPKVSLRYARTWRNMGHEVGLVFVYRPENADDLGARSDYFFEYNRKPTKFLKILTAVKYFIKNPILYMSLLISYFKIFPRFSREAIIYSGYGVFMNNLFKIYKPDVVLLEGALVKAFMAGKVAERLGLPIALDTYAEIRDPNMGVNKHLDENGKNRYWNGFLKIFDIVITLTNCSDGALKYLPREKVKVFFDTCDFAVFTSEVKETKKEIRKKFNLPEDRLLVGMVGAFEFRKGHDYLIKAIAEAKDKGSRAEAVFCGGSGDYSKWQLEAEKKGVSDRVHFFKNIPEIDLVKLHRAIDVYCNLSNTPRSCGFDLSLLEAMASGLPLIVYDNGQLSESISEGNGFVYKMNDVSGVADAVLKYEKMSAEERKKMGEGSTKIAKKADLNYTSVVKADWFKEIIERNKNK